MSSQRSPSGSVRITPSDHNTVAPSVDNTHAEPTGSSRLEGRVALIHNPHIHTEDLSLTELISQAFKSQRLADGEKHPADDIIAAFLDSDASAHYPCELESIVLNSRDADLVAATLQCVARFEPPWADWRKTDLVRNALRNEDICVRDAAVRAAESWLCPDIVTELERHQDNASWLQEYINEVIADAGYVTTIRSPQG